MDVLKKFLRDERGATAIEYSMIGAIVSIVIIGGAVIMGSKMNANLSTMGSALQ